MMGEVAVVHVSAFVDKLVAFLGMAHFLCVVIIFAGPAAPAASIDD